MTKTSAKTRSHSKPTKRSKIKTKASQASHKARAITKHDRVLGLLQAKRGATVAAISKATRWQPHSVRGFLAGVVKKKLGLKLISENTKSGRVHRIIAARPSGPSRSATASPGRKSHNIAQN
jgi:hypothetical protein